ncbi:lipocalin family protein [Rhodocytophaga rosea]|uniref:Lipocalin family protein n=1 Tax=Rhodocytophaga rosea TaxID=2704465 RepID=A0A6C0GNE3_9BACT|nr:lipocalin family protein [Rhodocytophaga rosea]QHT69556.1 lipocalin family protein [Rhodocytophaga rosea]
MKKISILYVCALSLLLFQTSCNKDDEAPAPNPMIGEWELYRLNVDFPGTSQSDGDYPANSFFNLYKITFNADDSFVEEVSAGGPISNNEGEWTLTNKEVTLNYDSGGDDETFTLNTENTLMTGETFNVNFGTEAAPNVGAVKFIFKKNQ